MSQKRPQEEREPGWIRQVLNFWFRELDRSDWFSKDDAVDTQIRERFLSLHNQLAKSKGAGITSARSLLAAVIVLDQYSRNLFRGSARAFAADPIARKLAWRAIDNQLDTDLEPEERYFLYLPFEHSEDRRDQEIAVKLISQLGNSEWTKYALAHQRLIDRFGRFPHRNAILGRESTAEEITAMNEPMGSF